jgi:hypothetical protein
MYLNPPHIKPRELQETAPWTLHLPTTNFQLLQYPRALTNKTIYRQLHKEIWENRSDTVPIFTDGSKTQTGNGCAIIYHDQISTFKLPTLFTVLSNELTAIKETIMYILQANDS